jgi:nuclear transport factor 2 (NTF2) superfamily protein
VWAYTDNRIAVRFQYEWHNDSGDFFAPTATKTGSSRKLD